MVEVVFFTNTKSYQVLYYQSYGGTYMIPLVHSFIMYVEYVPVHFLCMQSDLFAVS